MTKPKKTNKHRHDWQLLRAEYLSDFTDTLHWMEVLMACRNCAEVIEKKVKKI